MSGLLLHLGCGPIKLHGWVNIDHSDHWEPDVCMDYLQLSDRYPEGVSALVYSCHSLEHLAFPAGVLKCLEQAFRVLRPGGIFRVVVPDLLKVAARYVAGDDLKSIYGADHFYWRDMPATRFLYFMREWSHTVVFDEQLLGTMMRDAGFVNVRRCGFGQSDTPELRGIDRYPEESLSMEGDKA